MSHIPIPTPTHLEQRALFRHAIVGDLVVSDLPRGALNQELRERAKRRYRPPGATASRTYHWKTLQRWLYSARDGLAALAPASRRRGFALALDDEPRQLLLDMRREHPSAAADLLLDAAVRHGVIAKGAISLPTLRRLYSREGLSRRSAKRQDRAKDRRRWEAGHVCQIWHTDVCHVWRRLPDGSSKKVYVHAILDDNSRFIVAIKACEAETENDLLELLVETLMRYPPPQVLYTDNGATYRGDLLTLALDRLGIRLLHAAPYDPESRGKMERFFRTLRQRLLDHDHDPRTLHELNSALLAWVDVDYHRRKHGGLMGDTPASRFRDGLATLPAPTSVRELATALEVRRTAKVRKDATLSVDGTLYEVRGRHLAGKSVDVVLDPFTKRVIGVEHDGAAITFGVCEPRANALRSRAAAEATTPSAKRFQRIAQVLQAARELHDET